MCVLLEYIHLSVVTLNIGAFPDIIMTIMIKVISVAAFFLNLSRNPVKWRFSYYYVISPVKLKPVVAFRKGVTGEGRMVPFLYSGFSRVNLDQTGMWAHSHGSVSMMYIFWTIHGNNLSICNYVKYFWGLMIIIVTVTMQNHLPIPVAQGHSLSFMLSGTAIF